jgi:hypothetical protein
MIHYKKKVAGFGLAAAGFLIIALLVASVAMGGDGGLADDRIADLSGSRIESGSRESLAAALVSSNINYQGRLTDSSGNPLDGTYTMTFKLYESASGGTALATDTHSVTVTDGLFSTTTSLGTSSFDGRALWLGIKVGSDPEMTPRQELRPEPYALSLRPGAMINGSVNEGPVLEVINTEGINWGDGVWATVYSDGSYGVSTVAYGKDSRGVYARTYGNSSTGVSTSTSGYESHGVYANTSGYSSLGIYAETYGDHSDGVHAQTEGDYSEGFSAETSGYDSDGVVIFTTGGISVGLYANTSGYESEGVCAYTFGEHSEGVWAETSGDYSDGVHAHTEGDYSEGFSAETAGYDSDGIVIFTIGDYSVGYYANTSGYNSEGVCAYTYGDQSEGVCAYTFGDYSEGFYAYTSGYESEGFAAVTEGDDSQGVWAETYGYESAGLVVETYGDESEGIWAETYGYDSEGVVAVTDGDESEGVWAYTEGDYSEGVVAETYGYESEGFYAETYGYDSPAVYGYSDKYYGGVFDGAWPMGILVYGNIYKTGSCLFVEDHPKDPTKEIVYVCLEGGETGTYTRGSGQLIDGEAVVQLPEDFSLVTSSEGLTVQLTPTSDCKGLYIVSKSPTELVVNELNGGTSDATFDYLVNGVRNGYEEFQPIRDKQEMPERGDLARAPKHLQAEEHWHSSEPPNAAAEHAENE